MPTLTLVEPPPTETEPPDLPGPANVIQLPTPDADAAATARHLMRLGWTSSNALHSGMGMDVWAAMLAREIADEAGPSCPS
jgi:hypothetical protein